MLSSQNTFENEVQSALTAIFDRYHAIADLVDEMLKKQENNQDIASEMQRLEAARREVELVETATKEAKERYRAANQTASPAVKKLTHDSANLLTETIAKIEILENNTRSTQQKLLPQIGESVRANQMQQAYKNR